LVDGSSSSSCHVGVGSVHEEKRGHLLITQ